MSYIKDAGDRVWRYAPYAPLFIANHVAWLWLMGAYRVMWMYEELKDMAKLAVACVLATLINLGINAVFAIGYSRYVLGFLGVFGLVLVITSRYLLLLTHNIPARGRGRHRSPGLDPDALPHVHPFRREDGFQRQGAGAAGRRTNSAQC